jgi:hypothetical protein
MTANPWMFGLEAVQQGWQAQIALTLKLMRSFAGSVPDQISLSPTPGIVNDAKEQENVAFAPASAATIDEPKAPAANAETRRRKATKVLPAFNKSSLKTSKKTSHPKAVKNPATKALRRSARKPR